MPLVQRAAGLFPTRLVLDVGVKAGQPSPAKQRDPHRLRGGGGGGVARPVVPSPLSSKRSLRQGGIDRVDLVGEGIVRPVPIKVDLARGAVRTLFRALALVGLFRAEVPRRLQPRVQDWAGRDGRAVVRRVLLGLQFGEFGEGELGGRRGSRLLLRRRRRRRGRGIGRRRRRRRCIALRRRWRLLRRRRRIDLDRLGDLVLLPGFLLLDAVDVHRSLLLNGTSRTAYVRRLIDERRLARDV